MYPALSKTVFTVFMVLVPILLLNMLIAMMGNTYAHVIEQSEKEWMKQVRHDSILITPSLEKFNDEFYVSFSVGQNCSYP